MAYFKKITFALIALLAVTGCDTADYGDEALLKDAGFTNIDGTESYSSAGRPATLPTRAEIKLYNSDSPWYNKISSGATVDPDSATMVKSLVKAAEGGFVLQVGQYSSTVFVADASTPKYDVQLTCGPAWELGVTHLLQVPIPDFATPTLDNDGADVPISGCGDAADQDNNMVILDLKNRCEYDFWQARRINGQWTASWANNISLDGDGIYHKGLSTRGSGFAFLGGFIWPDELKAGKIEHAVAISYPFTKSGGPVAPASESDGITSDKTAIPEGARMQLDPSLNLDTLGLTGYQKTIAVAMQEYGVYMVDTGSETGIGMYIIDPASTSGNPYSGVLPDEEYVSLDDIPMNKVQVLNTGAQDPDFQGKLKVIDGPCSSFR